LRLAFDWDDGYMLHVHVHVRYWGFLTGTRSYIEVACLSREGRVGWEGREGREGWEGREGGEVRWEGREG
jgi:hypothetical protein